MKRFTEKINENKSEFNSNELDMGIKVESEHNDVYEYLKDHFGEMPLSKSEFYEKIAKAHLKEIPDYYSRLKVMENE